MNNENRPQQVPANADGNLRENHDDESALRSDWGSDESICESIGDGQPRDDLDEHREELQARDDQDPSLIDESGARTPDSLRLYYAYRVRHEYGLGPGACRLHSYYACTFELV